MSHKYLYEDEYDTVIEAISNNKSYKETVLNTPYWNELLNTPYRKLIKLVIEIPIIKSFLTTEFWRQKYYVQLGKYTKQNFMRLLNQCSILGWTIISGYCINDVRFRLHDEMYIKYAIQALNYGHMGVVKTIIDGNVINLNTFSDVKNEFLNKNEYNYLARAAVLQGSTYHLKNLILSDGAIPIWLHNELVNIASKKDDMEMIEFLKSCTTRNTLINVYRVPKLI